MQRIVNKLLISKILIYILLFIIMDQTLGYFLHKSYFTQKTGQNSSLNYIFNECNESVLIFGSSRAQHHYNPGIISKSLNMSCFNGGVDGGQSVLLAYAQIKISLMRYSPKLVILELNPTSMIFDRDDYDKLSTLLPYYSDYPDLRPLILLRGPFERIKLLSAIYPYNSNVINIIRYNTNSHAARKLDIQGFVPIENRLLTKLPEINNPGEAYYKTPIDTNKVNALKSIINICQQKNVRLVIVNSPIYHQDAEFIKNTLPVTSQIQDIFKSEKITYFDFSNDSLFNQNMSWFGDQQHLNGIGANIFSQKIVKYLKSELNIL